MPDHWGFQYAAEISYPAPESTSQGILLWVGQLTGMIFVAGMSIRENQYLGIFMNIFVILSILVLIMQRSSYDESNFMKTESRAKKSNNNFHVKIFDVFTEVLLHLVTIMLIRPW